MSDKTKTGKGAKEKVLSETEVRRRNLQYQELRNYYYGKTTARECIEKILNIEKIIFFDRRPNGR